MKLTIGMIVKNEEKWLDKCLSAIKPILDNVDSELIITDTGSSDRTVEIAMKYTDKVLHFDWIKDFSAARNFGLEKAQGEWFMMLDADDIFISCENIIRFFNSGEYKKYNSATYISRNLFNTADCSDYSDLRVMRLVKILPETKYVNAVHEHINTFGEPVRNISDIALHYGYAYDNGINVLAKKQDRNLELLLNRLEAEGGTNEMLYIQLFQCCSARFEHEKAAEYLETGRKLCIKNNSIVLAVVYAEKARLEFRNENYADVIDICDQYFSMDIRIRPDTLTTDAEMYYLRAMSFKNLEQYDDAVTDFCGLFDIYYDVICGKIVTDDAYLQSYEYAITKNYVTALCDFIKCCILSGKCDIADKYIYECSKEITSEKIDEKVREKLRFTLISLFLAAGNEDILSLLDEKYSFYRNYSEISENDIIDFACRYGIDDNPEMVAVIMQKHYDITVLFENADTDLKKCAYKCCKLIVGFYDIAESYSEKCIRNTDDLPIAAEFIDYCISVKLIENENKPKEYREKIIAKLFRLKNNINEKYKARKADDEFTKLSEIIKQNIRIYISDGDFKSASKTLEEYKMLNPNDTEISDLIELIKKR